MARRLSVKRKAQAFWLLVSGVLIVAFQNCAQESNDMCITGQCPSDQASTTDGDSSSPVKSPNFGGDSGDSGGGSGGDSPHFGPITGGGGGGGSSGGSFNTNTNGMRFAKDKNLKNGNMLVGLDKEFTLDVLVEGGQYPLTFTWYRNRKRITTAFDAPYFVDFANRYYKEGSYHVEIKDSGGGTLVSNTLNLKIAEPENGCAAGNYVIGQGPDKTGMQDVTALFITPRGNYYVLSNHPDLSYLMSHPGYWGLSRYSFASGRYKETRAVGCGYVVPAPRITPSPPRTYTDEYSDTQIIRETILECSNNKWKILTTSCYL